MDQDDLFSDKLNLENVSLGGESMPTPKSEKKEVHQEELEGKLETEISEATNEKEKIIFVIETKTDMKKFKKSFFSVQRFHEDFVWLYEKFAENPEYSGYIIPSPPTKPNFEPSKAKLQKLNQNDNVFTKDEMEKLRKEINDEYLAVFKKTVSIHEMFIKKITKHKILREDYNFLVFLEYEGPMNVRVMNLKEKASIYLKSFTQTADEILLPAELRDESSFYTNEKVVLDNYYQKIKSAASLSESVVKLRRNYTQAQLQVEVVLNAINDAPPASQFKIIGDGKFDQDYTKTIKLFGILGNYLSKVQKFETEIYKNEDFKLTDCLKYIVRDTESAKRLFLTRNKLIIDVTNAKKLVEKAQTKRRDIQSAIDTQNECKKRLENYSEISKSEIEKYKTERATFLRTSLIDLAELQIKTSKEYQNIAKSMLEEINELSNDNLRSK